MFSIQVASRIIWQAMGVILIFLGIFGKFGAATSVLPDPIIAGLAMVGFGKHTEIRINNMCYKGARPLK